MPFACLSLGSVVQSPLVQIVETACTIEADKFRAILNGCIDSLDTVGILQPILSLAREVMADWLG